MNNWNPTGEFRVESPKEGQSDEDFLLEGADRPPPMAPLSAERSARIKEHRELLLKSAIDRKAGVCTEDEFQNERHMLFWKHNHMAFMDFGVAKFEDLTVDMVLDIAARTSYPLTQNKLLSLAQCLELRQTYTYRLF